MELTAGAEVDAARPLVSVIIVLYNSAEHIAPCLESVAALEYRPLEVVMVDNASRDGSARVAREAAGRLGLRSLISELPRNRGFAAACNHGFALASGDPLLLLNPDTEVFPGMLGNLVDAMGDSGIGVAGCKVFSTDGQTLQQACCYVRDTALTMNYGVGEPDDCRFDELRDVAYVTGAALAVRRGVFEDAGGLDPGYFPAYFEEVDLCLSARRLGYRVAYVPGAGVLHHESVTTGRFTRRYYYLYHRNRVRFLLKSYSWRFLLERALPMEQRWLGMIDRDQQAQPLNRAYLANIAMLPRTLLARYRMERRLNAPRIEDTVSEL